MSREAGKMIFRPTFRPLWNRLKSRITINSYFILNDTSIKAGMRKKDNIFCTYGITDDISQKTILGLNRRQTLQRKHTYGPKPHNAKIKIQIHLVFKIVLEK